MRTVDELRSLTAGRLLEIWRQSREQTEDPLERTLLCNARVLAECCWCQGERVYGDELEVLRDLTGRQMEHLLRQLTEERVHRQAAENPRFDEERFEALRKR